MTAMRNRTAIRWERAAVLPLATVPRQAHAASCDAPARLWPAVRSRSEPCRAFTGPEGQGCPLSAAELAIAAREGML